MLRTLVSKLTREQKKTYNFLTNILFPNSVIYISLEFKKIHLFCPSIIRRVCLLHSRTHVQAANLQCTRSNNTRSLSLRTIKFNFKRFHAVFIVFAYTYTYIYAYVCCRNDRSICSPIVFRTFFSGTHPCRRRRFHQTRILTSTGHPHKPTGSHYIYKHTHVCLCIGKLPQR